MIGQKGLNIKRKFMERFYYENKLSNQNITAKPNIAWVADTTEFELVVNQRALKTILS